MQQDLVIRAATHDDRAAIASWYEDKVRHSFHRKPLVVSKDQHRQWFETWMDQKGDKLLGIGLVDIIRVAAIRFDRADVSEFNANVLIRSPYLGKNLSAKLLQQGHAFLLERHPKANVTARLPYINESSRNVFVEAGLVVSEPLHGVFTVRLEAA
jgi:hypothetical protein